MPYAIKGKTVYKKNTGEKVGDSANPKRYLRTLQAIEHGWKPSQNRNKQLKAIKRLKK